MSPPHPREHPPQSTTEEPLDETHAIKEKASDVAWRMSPAPRRVKSVAGGRDVEADGCGHDEDGGAEFCD